MPSSYAPADAARVRERIAAAPRLLVLLRSTLCPYGATFHPVFHEKAAAAGIPSLDLLVEEHDAAQWEAWGMRVSPTAVLFVDGREAARLDGVLLLGITRQRFSRWLRDVVVPSGTGSPAQD